MVPADPEPGRLRLHVHLRHRLPHRGQPDVRRDAGDRPGRPAARHLRLQDRRRHHPRPERRAAEPGAAHADPAPVAQDRARQRRQRHVRRRPGRRRPEPQLPDQLGPRRGGRRATRLQRHLPRPVPALGARGPRVRPAAAPDHARGGHQLPLGGPAAAVRRSATSPTSTPTTTPWFKALTGTDGDAAVDPYISQRSSDLYITNGETTDHAYNKYGVDVVDAGARRVRDGGRRHVLLRRLGLHVPGRRGQGRGRLPEEPDFARNVAATTLDRDRPDRPRNATADETQYQVKASPDIEPNRFNVSYGADPDARGDRAPRSSARSTSSSRSPRARAARSRTLTLRAHAVEGRRALRRPARQVLPARPRADPGGLRPAGHGAARRGRWSPVTWSTSASSRARSSSGSPTASSPRGRPAAPSACSWSRPRTTRACRRTRRRTPPRRATSTSTSRRSTANGYAVETFDVDAPPAGPDRHGRAKQISDLGVLSHFDAVLYYTGDDLRPAGGRRGRRRRRTTAAAGPSARTARSASPARCT